MPLNWLQSMQYADIPGAMAKGATGRNVELQNKILKEKLHLSEVLSSSMENGGGVASSASAGGDSSTSNALLERLAIIDPQAAATLLKVKDTTNPTPFSGEGFQNQLAGAQYRAYKKAGYNDEEAALRAGSDVATMKQEMYTDAMGNQHTVTSKPLPKISTRGKELITDLMNAPEADRPDIYKQKLKEASDEGLNVEGLPDQYSKELGDQLKELYPTLEATTDEPAAPVELFNDTGSVDNTVVNSPKVNVARAEEESKLNAKKVSDWKEEATAAAEGLGDFQRVYETYNNGFKGGPLAGFDMAKIQAKRAMNQPLTQEEQEFTNGYTLLESTAQINVAKQIKPIFGGNISDGEREFAIALQAAPMDIQEQAIAKAAVQEAGSLQKIRKVEMLDEWQKHYGSVDAKNGKGQSFDSFYSSYVKQNPILTSEFLSERGAVVPVKSVKQAGELAVGTRFIAPDGKIRVRK